MNCAPQAYTRWAVMANNFNDLNNKEDNKATCRSSRHVSMLYFLNNNIQNLLVSANNVNVKISSFQWGRHFHSLVWNVSFTSSHNLCHYARWDQHIIWCLAHLKSSSSAFPSCAHDLSFYRTRVSWAFPEQSRIVIIDRLLENQFWYHRLSEKLYL